MTKKIAKWFTYAMLGVLAFCLIFSVSACGLMPDTSSDDVADSGDDGEKREANIYDSYDDSRPNYDEEFDFESGYTPAYTPEGVPVTVTIVLPNEISLSSSYDNSIWETGMTMTMDTLPQENDLVGYEVYSSAHDKHLIGWYVYDDEGNSYRLTSDGMYGISDTTPLTVYPLFQDNFYDLDVNDNRSDPTTLNDMGVGSGVEYPDDTSKSNTAASFQTVFNTNDFIEEQMLVYTDELYVGNWFRINTLYRVDGEKTVLDEGKTYTASYALTNYCEEPIVITLYHATNGWPYGGGSMESEDFDKDILEIEPGETAYSTLTVSYTSDRTECNFLTPVIYGAWYNTDSSAADCESKKTGISNYGLGTITDFRLGIRCHVEETEYIDVRYALPEGVSFVEDSGYTEETFSAPKNVNLNLPMGDDFVYTGKYTNQYLLEWRLADESGNATDTVIISAYRISSDCVLVPVFADKCKITIEPLEGAAFSYTTAYVAKGGTLKLPSVELDSDAEIYGYYLSNDSSQTVIGQPRRSITVSGDMTLCLKIENILTRVTVTLASGYDDIVKINSYAVEHIHNGEAGSLYNALYGDESDISYSEYKDFGETPTWEVSCDNGSTWATVTENYTIPSTVSRVIIRPVYSDIYITVTVDSSVEHFTLTSNPSFQVVYGDTWGQYLSSNEIGNNIEYELSDGYLFAYWTVDGTAVNLEDEIPYHNGTITLVPVVNTAAEIVLELPDGVTLDREFTMPMVAVGGTIYESDLPTTENFTGVENGREILGWYVIEVNSVTGQTTNVVIGSGGYTIYSDTVTIAPYWTRVEGSYTAVLYDGTEGDPVFLNEQSTGRPNSDVISGLTATDFTGIPSRNENVYPVSAGGGYAEMGTYFSYTGIMPEGAYFRCATEINYNTAVVTVGVEHAFVYTFENKGTTDIYLTMQLVNSGTNAEGNIYYIYLKPGESIQLTIVMAFSNGGTNKNIMALFTVDKEMNGMSMAASVSFILNNSTNLSSGYVTNATDAVYQKESYTITYVLPTDASLADSFNGGSNALVQIREKGIVLPTADDIILDEGEAKYKNLTWYVIVNGQEREVHDGDDFDSDTTIYLKIEDIKITVTVDIAGIDGISLSSGGTSSTFEALYGNSWNEYLSDEALEKLGFTLDDGYSVTGWHTESWDTINLGDIVPEKDIAIFPVLAYVGEVEVKLSNAYSENIVTIISLDGHVLAGVEGALYNALRGQDAVIEYNQYKDFGEYVWYATADGSQWEEVTENYAVPDGVTRVTVYLKYDDIKITITVDDSVENFTLTSDSTFEVTYGDTWGQYLSFGEIGNNVEYVIAEGYVFGYWAVDGVKVDFSAIVPNEQGITLVPVLNKLVTIEAELPNGVTLSANFNMPELIDGDTLYEKDLPTTEDFTGVENGREILGWYVIEKDDTTGRTENVLIGSSGYIIESETVTVAPYWSRVTDSYEAQFSTGASGDPVFNNEQSNSKPNKVENGLSQSDFTALPERYENVYPVSAGGGYAEMGTYFSYNGTMPVGGTFRCTTFIDSGNTVVTKGVEHAFIYTFENIGTTDIYLTMQLVNDGTNVEGDIYYIYLKPGESIQFTIVMSFSNGGDNHNIMAYFTVAQEMDGMSMAASVSLILNNSMNMSTGFVTNATNDVYKERYTLTYVLPDGTTLSSSFNGGSDTLVQFREDGIVLPTAEDLILSDGSDARYKKLAWYTMTDGQYVAVSAGDDFASDMTICLYVEDIKVSVTVDFAEITGINRTSGSTVTITAVYGNLWSEYLNESSLGYTLDTGYFVAGWQTTSGEDIELSGIVPNEDVSVKPVVEYANVTVTIGSVSGVTVSASTIDAYVGANLLNLIETDMASGTLIVTTDSDITELKGWSLADGGEMIGSDYTVSGNVTIYPVIGYKSATVTIKIEVEGVEVKFTYGGTTYTNGQSFELQATCMDDLYNLISNANISGTVSTEGFEFLGQWMIESGSVITEGTTIESVSVTVIPVISRKSYSVSVRTIKGDDGSVIFEASGYSTTYVVYGDTFALPSAEQVTNSTGKELIGWVIKYADGSYSVSYTYVKGTSNVTVTRTGDYSLGAEIEMPAGTIEILPLLYESDEYIPWELDYYRDVNGKDNNTRKDAFTTGAYYSEATYETDYFIKDAEDGVMNAGDYIRYKNAYTVTSGTGYDFHYTITNLGSATITIKIYQMNSGADLSSSGTISAQSDELSIAPGETVTVSFYDIENLGNNGNTLTIIQAVNEIDGLYLGINERIDVHEDVNPASVVSTYSCEASLEEKRRGC